MPAALSLPDAFSSPAAVDTNVEKCFEDGTRGRAAPTPCGVPLPVPAAAAAPPGAAALAAAAAAAVVVVVVCEAAFELARKRDWEWLEK